MASHDSEEQCESGCGPATKADSQGVPLCDSCAWALDREVLDDIAKLVGFDRDKHDDLMEAVKERLAHPSAGAGVADEMVEAAAKCLYEYNTNSAHRIAWENYGSIGKETFRDAARKTLTAALTRPTSEGRGDA